MDAKPFLNIVVAMDEINTIAHQGQIPWAPLPTDHHWYLTHATTTKDPSKRIALIVGRVTFEDTVTFDEKYVSRWNFIVVTTQPAEKLCQRYSRLDRKRIDVVSSFDQAVRRAKDLLETPSAMIESVCVFGGVRPYEQAIASKLVKRIYLTRIFAKLAECDTRLSKFSLEGFQRIKRPPSEPLAELDDKIIEENGWRYQFQVYERIDA